MLRPFALVSFSFVTGSFAPSPAAGRLAAIAGEGGSMCLNAADSHRCRASRRLTSARGLTTSTWPSSPSPSPPATPPRPLSSPRRGGEDDTHSAPTSSPALQPRPCAIPASMSTARRVPLEPRTRTRARCVRVWRVRRERRREERSEAREEGERGERRECSWAAGEGRGADEDVEEEGEAEEGEGSMTGREA